MKSVELHKRVKAIHSLTETLLIALENEMSETELNDRAAQEHADAVIQAKLELQAESMVPVFEKAVPVVERAQPIIDKPIAPPTPVVPVKPDPTIKK